MVPFSARRLPSERSYWCWLTRALRRICQVFASYSLHPSLASSLRGNIWKILLRLRRAWRVIGFYAPEKYDRALGRGWAGLGDS